MHRSKTKRASGEAGQKGQRKPKKSTRTHHTTTKHSQQSSTQSSATHLITPHSPQPNPLATSPLAALTAVVTDSSSVVSVPARHFAASNRRGGSRRGSAGSPLTPPQSAPSQFQGQFDHRFQTLSDGQSEGDDEDRSPSMFFPQSKADTDARKAQNKAKMQTTRLETLKGFLAADPTQYGMDRKTQQQIAAQMLEQIEEENKLENMDESEVMRMATPKSHLQQLAEFENVPLETYLKHTGGVDDPAHLLRTLKQNDKARKHYQTQIENMTSSYQLAAAAAAGVHPHHGGEGEGGEYEEEEMEVSPEQLEELLAKFKPTRGPNGELIFDEEAFLMDGQVGLDENYDLGEDDGDDGDDADGPQPQKLKRKSSQLAQYQNTLGEDPSIFKYVDDDYEYYIPPGMSVQKLTTMDLPVETILNYIRKQIAEGQVQTNYMGISLQQLMKKLQLENFKRAKKGLKPIELNKYSATTFKDIDTSRLSPEDSRDLEAYYNHFETFRHLKRFEKMKDNPGYDKDDPDWQDDDEPSTKLSKRQLKKISRADPELAQLLKKDDGTVMDLDEIGRNDDGKLSEEQRRRILQKYGTPESKWFTQDLAHDDGNDILGDEESYQSELKRRAAIERGDAFERELQYPDHKPTIKALQNFVRTVPMDEPIPKELQRRVNLLLGDAEYRKLKDYHFMMNDVEIWYLANRLPVVYSIMRRILIEVRQRIPTWKPERVLEFAAGASPALWAVRDIFYQDIAEYTAVERDGRLALLGQQLTADLGIHIYYRSRLLVNEEGQMEMSQSDDLKRERKRAKLSHKQRKLMDKEDKIRKEQQLAQMGKKHTLVFSPYALSKQPNKEYRRLLLEALWDQVDPNGGLLVIIESTEADASGFNVVRECRDYLLKKYPKTKIQEEHIVDDKKLTDAEIITPIVRVEDNIDGSADANDPTLPDWAQGATKKLTTEEEAQRQAVNKPTDPSASSILPCSHDRPCPMGAMLKLNEEVKKLKVLAQQEQLAVTLPQVPIKSCMFGQRMLRAPMPNQSPLQDLEIPQFLGDAIIENFSYIVLRRGEIPIVKNDDLEVVPYESAVIPKGKLNLPGGMTREEYLELKKWEREQEEAGAFDPQNMGSESEAHLDDLKSADAAAESARIKAEQAELGDFIDDDEDGNLEFDLLVQQTNEDKATNNLRDIEARRLAIDIFGTKSIDNEESLENHTEAMIGKLAGAKKVNPNAVIDETSLKAKQDSDEIDPEHQDLPQRDILEDYDLDIIQKELGYELDAEALETLRQVILESERDRPLLNPKREFNLNRWSRVLSPPLKRGGHVLMDLCTPDGNFERRIVGREGVGALGFKQARLMNWGDVWPYKRPTTLRELKEERDLEMQIKDSPFANVTSSQEAKDTINELRDLFGTHYTTDQIQHISRFKDQLKPGQDGTDATHKRRATVAREDLNFDNMDEDFNPELAEQIKEVEAIRLESENRYKASQKERRKDTTPSVVVESNIFNDPGFYDADFVDSPDAHDTFQAELRAHKLLEDLKSLPAAQQQSLGGDVASALQSLGASSKSKSKSEEYLRSLDDESWLEHHGMDDKSSNKKAKKAQTTGKSSLLSQLQDLHEDDAKHQRAQMRKEFADDLTEYSEETGLPEGFENINELTPAPLVKVPTKLSHGTKVDDIIHSVERRIEAIKEDKKERNKLNKKQQKIAEKQRQKELAKLGLDNIDEDDGTDNEFVSTGDIQKDFAKLMAQNVEFDPSLADYHETRRRQDAELQRLRQDLDNDDESYDEHDEGASDYSDGEIHHVPEANSDVDDGPNQIASKPKPIDVSLAQSVDLRSAKSGEWVSGHNKTVSREALRAKLFDVMAQKETDELLAFIDDPTLVSSGKKERENYKKQVKEAAKAGEQAKGDGLTRAQRLKKEQMRREYLFSDDDEWDLNANDGIANTKGEGKEGGAEEKGEKKVHTIQGAALDVVDHSYRVLSTGAKAKLGVPLTGKRSFVENLDLLEQNAANKESKQARNPFAPMEDDGDDSIQYLEVSAKNQKSKNPDIFGYRKKNQQPRTLPPRQYNNNNSNNSTRSGRRNYSTPQHQQMQSSQSKSAVLLTMPGQTAPKKSTTTKVIQIGTKLNQQKLYPNRLPALDVLNVNKHGPAVHHTSIYNTILTEKPSVDLAAADRTTPIIESTATALSKHNKDQIENIATKGIFKYDGGMPLSTHAMYKSSDMARKLQTLAGVDPAQAPEGAPMIAPTPGKASPFVDNSAPPQEMDHSPEAISAQATRSLFGNDIFVYEEDANEKRYKDPKFDEVRGLLRRDRRERELETFERELREDPEGDLLETMGRDIYANVVDRAQTRHDQFGREYTGKVGGDSPDAATMQHFKEQSETKRRLESRKRRAEFSMRIDAAREEASRITGTPYSPNIPTHGPVNGSSNNKKNAQIKLSEANLGEHRSNDRSSGQPFYRERISELQDEIDQVKKLRRDRQRKMLTPLALSDELARDPEGNLLESIKAQPSIWAKTSTEKRASLAVIEQPDEHELRKLRESHGLDYSYTALLTNLDGFGPKMDEAGKIREKKLVTPFDQDTITLGELENLAKHASDELRPQLSAAVNQAHQTLLHDKTVQNDYKDAILSGHVRDVPFKLKLSPKPVDPQQKLLPPGSSKPKKDTFDYEIRPMTKQELALIYAEQKQIVNQPDLTKDVESLLMKHQSNLSFTQKQSLLSQDHDQQIKLSLQTQQLGSLARRFTQMAKQQEDRDLLRGDSDGDYAFQPPEVPDMQSSWGVKTRTPDRHKTATIATDQFVKQQRKYDRFVAEVQEVDLLDRLTSKSIKVPESIQNKFKSPYEELEHERAKELLIKQGLKTRQQVELEELQEALAFERGMQQAVDEHYGEAKKELKHKLRQMARDSGVTPEQFNLKANKGFLDLTSRENQALLGPQDQEDLKLILDPNTFVRNKQKKLAQMEQKLLLAHQSKKNSHDDDLFQEAQVVPNDHSNSKGNNRPRGGRKNSPRM